HATHRGYAQLADRARRGVRGALYPKSTHGGLNSRPRPEPLLDRTRSTALRVGSCATEPREPSQVRKEAALSGSSRVPQARLTGAVGGHRTGGDQVDGGCTVRSPAGPRGAGPTSVQSVRGLSGAVPQVPTAAIRRRRRPGPRDRG